MGRLNAGNKVRFLLVQVHQQFVVDLQDEARPGAFQQFAHIDHGDLDHGPPRFPGWGR